MAVVLFIGQLLWSYEEEKTKKIMLQKVPHTIGYILLKRFQRHRAQRQRGGSLLRWVVCLFIQYRAISAEWFRQTVCPGGDGL